MLSEKVREALVFSLEYPRKLLGEESFQEACARGPEYHVDSIITGSSRPWAVEELKANRDEAVKIVAAAMGMM